MSTRIILIDSQTMLREGLRALFERRADFKVVGEAGDGQAAIRLASELSPQLVIMDAQVPDMRGAEVIRHILAVQPEIKVIVLSASVGRETVHEMLKAGAASYVSKYSIFEELLHAVDAVRANQYYLSPQVTRHVVDGFLSPRQSKLSLLSPREAEVLRSLVAGRSAKEIANTLFISVKTVNTHRQQLMEKLGLSNLASLVKFALREELISLDE